MPLDLKELLAPAHTAPPAAYALVGMAALLAATTHAPLLATVFAFEVTRDYAIVLQLLLTTRGGRVLREREAADGLRSAGFRNVVARDPGLADDERVITGNA